MRRLHAAKDDLDWLPKNYRLLRGAVIGGVWTAIGGGLGAAMLFGAHVFVFGKVFFAIGAGGYWLGDRVSKSVVSSRLAKLASGKVDLSRLSNSEDGDLVHVRGVVRAVETVPSRFGNQEGVYRRVRASFDGYQAVEEQAVDFQLVDAEGNAILVEVEAARWIVHDGKQKLTSTDLLSAFVELPKVQRFVARSRTLPASKKQKTTGISRATEAMLRDGDEVEVVGYKSRTVDPQMADRMFRDTPMRATLRAGKDLPLVISTVGKRGEA